jgi:hypothetical protein
VSATFMKLSRIFLYKNPAVFAVSAACLASSAPMVEGGFVEHVSIHKRYRLTPKSLWVAPCTDGRIFSSAC